MDLPEAAALAADRLNALAVAEGIPTVDYGLVRHGALVHRGTLGEVSATAGEASAPPRAFRIASMTKSFTAATILALRDDARIDLDAPLRDYLPWTASLATQAGHPPLCARHLLTMCAGFPTDDPWGDRQEGLPLEAFDALVESGLSFARPPGLDFEYSNLGYALLGRVIAAVTMQPYTDVVRERILDPLGLSRTAYDVRTIDDREFGWHPTAAGLVEQDEPVPGAFSPMGGLWSTTVDLAVWVEFMMSAWTDEGDSPILSRWSRREMQRPHILARIEPGGVAQSYGMGLYIADDIDRGRFIHHSGGYPGFGSHMRWHPRTGWGIVALGNRTYAPLGRACTQILNELVDAEPLTAERVHAGLWPQTQAAMDLAEALLRQWDDGALDAHAAMNLDLDQSRHERRAIWQQVGERLGPFERDSIESTSPAHARWIVTADNRQVQLEVLMSPESPPRIQALRVNAVERPNAVERQA